MQTSQNAIERNILDYKIKNELKNREICSDKFKENMGIFSKITRLGLKTKDLMK